MSNNKLYNASYFNKRRAVINVWKARNFFGYCTDMFGVKISNSNTITTHHIYDKNRNFMGLAVLSKYVHAYLDEYLKERNPEEYMLWSEYLHEVTEYLSKNRKVRIEQGLMDKRDLLLLRFYIDKNNKNSVSYKRMYNCTKDLILSILLRNDINIYEPETICEIEKNYIQNVLPNEPINYRPLKYKQFEIREDFKDVIDAYYKERFNIANKTWMNSCEIADNMVEGEYLLSKNDFEILKYIKETNLIDKWKRVLYARKNKLVDQKILDEYTEILRRNTFDTIYLDLLKEENKDLKTFVQTRMYETSHKYRTIKYGTDSLREQECVEFIRIVNSRSDEQITYDNEIVNNDTMGTNYISIGPDNKYYYLSSIGAEAIEVLKGKNPELLSRWQKFFNVFGRKDLIENLDETSKECFLDLLNKTLASLRLVTKNYFENLLSNTQNKSHIIKYSIIVNEFSNRPIKIYIRGLKEVYDSTLYDTNLYLDFINYPHEYTKCNEITNVKLNYGDVINNAISSQNKSDWFGLKYSDAFEQSDDIINIFGVDAFLHGRSVFILSILKEKDINVFNEWVELFKKINDSDPSLYDEEITNLLVKTHTALRPYKNKMDDKAQFEILKLKRAYHYRMRNVKKN